MINIGGQLVSTSLDKEVQETKSLLQNTLKNGGNISNSQVMDQEEYGKYTCSDFVLKACRELLKILLIFQATIFFSARRWTQTSDTIAPTNLKDASSTLTERTSDVPFLRSNQNL